MIILLRAYVDSNARPARRSSAAPQPPAPRADVQNYPVWNRSWTTRPGWTIIAPNATQAATMDVGDWLRSLGLGQYHALFREHEIDAEVLPDLTDADLEKFGVPFGHRKRLIKAIAKLEAQAPERPDVAPAAPPAPLRDAAAERRHLTVMFCDLVGSTAISASLDAEDWRNLVSAYLDAASEAVTQMGGHVAKKLGDGIMALFGHPIAQESDAERAVRAALAIQRALAELNRKGQSSGAPELVARIGIAAGAVVVDSAGEIFGDAPNIAARVQALAEPGTVLVTARVQRQVAGLFVAEDRGAHELKGAPEPTTLYRIVRASGAGRRSGQRALTPLIGRDEEVATLLRRWERARQGEGQFVMIVGEPGLGKSRLIEEFRARLVDTPHTWVEWSSSQLLQNTPLHPIAEWGRQRFGGADVAQQRRLAELESTLAQVKLDPADYVPLLAPLVDIPLPAERAAHLAPEELRRRQMAALNAWVMAGARTQPIVLAFEDLHWADPTTLDVLRGFAERGALAPLLVLATTRPEFRAPWGARSHHGTITLSPLDRTQVRQMVGALAERHALSGDVVDGVGDRTGGVPLFIEEVTRLLLERGGQGGAQAIPPTLQQSLAARLDRLGPAREVAMTGAVLGRGFSFSLLRSVAGLEEAPLREALDKLAEADILLVEGLPPDADYRFKHALIQDAAYENLLKSRRQALHRRVAETLRDQFADRAAAEPELLAHHFTQAGLAESAIEYWGKAGDLALRRSAFQEAIAHLGKAVEMADKGGATATSDRLKLQTSYGSALAWGRGVAAEETQAAAARTKQLAAEVNDPAARFRAFRVQYLASAIGGQIASARATAETYLEEAKNADAPSDIGWASTALGQTRMFEGAFADARAHLEQGREIYARRPNIEVARSSGAAWRASGTAYPALVSWQLGEVERAQELMGEAKTLADASQDGLTLAITYSFAPIFETFRGDADAALRNAETLAEIVARTKLPDWSGVEKIYRGWVRARRGDREAGLEECRQGLAEHAEQKSLVQAPFYQHLMAELEADEPSADAALTRIEGALALAEQTDQRWTDAFLHRIRGDILLKTDPENPARAEGAYLAAIVITQQQGARSFGLQAALKLAKLYQSTGRPVEAHDLLAPALEGFSPTPELREIAEAQALLAALAATGEMKAARASRTSRLDLQTNYGLALTYGRGIGAKETNAAAARMKQLAADVSDPAARFAAYHVQFVASVTAGQIGAAALTAKTFLSEAKNSGGLLQIALAGVMMGHALMHQGAFADARDHLQEALGFREPQGDVEVKAGRTMDIRTYGTVILALVCWQLGEVERARDLIISAKRRADKLRDGVTSTNTYFFSSLLEAFRGDAEATLRDAEALADITEKIGIPLYSSLAKINRGWARARLGHCEAGLAELREAMAVRAEKNALGSAQLFQGWLAELEVEEQGAVEPLARIDAALALAEQTDQRSTDALLHRIRGDILLKADRDNPGGAEEAYLAAIAIAREQGARSFGLQGALKLAKLYQSTGRPVEAHDILAPALEGFSPTPELPEIAEAQALLATLAEATGRPASTA